MKENEACCATDCCSTESESVITLEKGDLEIKEKVRSRYSEIARSRSTGCGCEGIDAVAQTADYKQLEGYQGIADLGLGCGSPTATNLMREGDTILDLGSGAGSDIFIARKAIGETGFAIGVDFSEDMISLAEENARKLGFENTKFILSDIESLPVPSDSVDVVTSNCVINLVPNKQKVFSEVLRVLKPGGYITISDIVSSKPLPAGITQDEDLYCACVGGATTKEEYLSLLAESGFEDINVSTWRTLSVDNLPADLGVGSLTVVARKPKDSN